MDKKRIRYQVINPPLVRLLSFEGLQLPTFQRHYGWGEKGALEKGVEYLANFLLNKERHPIFGSVYIYSDQRYNYDIDDGIRVWVSDGQHRLVTVVLSAKAILRRLKEIAKSPDLDADEREALDYLLSAPELVAVAQSRLEVLLDEFGRTAQVVKFIDETLHGIAHQSTRRTEIQERYKTKREALAQIEARAERTLEKRAIKKEEMAELTRLDEEIAEFEKIGAFSTFRRIEEFLAEKKDAKVIQLAERFVERIAGMLMSMPVVHPAENHNVPLPVLEAESFAMFADINSQATPLTSGELLNSAVQALPQRRPVLQRYFKRGTAEFNAISYFGLTNFDTMSQFLTQMHNGDSQAADTWVRTTFYSAKASRTAMEEVEGWLSALRQCSDRIKSLSVPLRSLFDLFFLDFKRGAYAVACARFVMNAGIEKCDEGFMKSLLKLLVMFEVCSLYRTPTNKNFKISRDVADVRMNSLAAGISLVLEHFEVPTMSELNAAMVKFLSTAPMGQASYRKLTKLLLVLADVNNGGRDVQIPAWKAYEYEHVLPNKCDNLKSDSDMPADALAGIEEILNMAEHDRKHLVQLLGNGGLLNKRENITLSNWPPYTKFAKQAEDGFYSNAWWPTHLRSLQDSKGNFDAAFIRQRSVKLAEQIAAFLLSGDSWATVMPNVDAAVAQPTVSAPEAFDRLAMGDGFAGIDQLVLKMPVAPAYRQAA